MPQHWRPSKVPLLSSSSICYFTASFTSGTNPYELKRGLKGVLAPRDNDKFVLPYSAVSAFYGRLAYQSNISRLSRGARLQTEANLQLRSARCLPADESGA